MTPQLQQAIKLLQLSRMELMDLIRQEQEENPVIEESSEPAQETEPLESSYETLGPTDRDRTQGWPGGRTEPSGNGLAGGGGFLGDAGIRRGR